MEQQTKLTAKQIAAWLGIILLIVLVFSTLLVSFLSFEGQDKVLIALFLCDIAVPVFLWFCLRMAKNNAVQRESQETDEGTEE